MKNFTFFIQQVNMNFAQVKSYVRCLFVFSRRNQQVQHLNEIQQRDYKKTHTNTRVCNCIILRTLAHVRISEDHNANLKPDPKLNLKTKPEPLKSNNVMSLIF
ncbi:hypothetical protein AMECASPLE_029553 [Ameca splendens]|uniref:Uncharacterized protein n=1 Tax=Ameca splendens TaxID=208324 RepID=A0ABV0XUY6_9TELE